MTSHISEKYLPPRERLVYWLARLYKHHLTTTTGGNLSLIDDDGVLYITPSGGDKALVSPSDVALCKPGSNVFEGTKQPSMEWRLHTSAYSARKDCRACLHAHSVALIAFSLAMDNGLDSTRCFQIDHPGIPDTRCLFSAWMTCGRVAFAPYFPPGSDEVATVCTKMLSQANTNCVILQNHGVIVVGSSLQEAFDRFVTLENLAQTIINALPIGVPRPLKESILSIKEQRNAKYQKFLCAVPCYTAPSTYPSMSKSKPQHRIITGHEKEVRSEICRFIERAYKHNIFTSSSGSISMRCNSTLTSTSTLISTSIPTTDTTKVEHEQGKIDELSYLVTPTPVDRQNVDPSTLCFISNSAFYTSTMVGGTPTIIKTNRAQYHPDSTNITSINSSDSTHNSTSSSNVMVMPSHASEIHETIYSMHPEINSIIIAQPPFATSFCITGKKLNSAGIPESHLILGNVKTLPFECLENGGVALSKALGTNMNTTTTTTTVLIDGFGLLSVGTGKNLLQTYVQVEVCESICAIMLTSMRRGTPALLTDDQVKEIDVLFQEEDHHQSSAAAIK